MEEPVAVIKITFDDINIPDELKDKLYLFFSILLVLIILSNIYLGFYILEHAYKKIRQIKEYRERRYNYIINNV